VSSRHTAASGEIDGWPSRDLVSPAGLHARFVPGAGLVGASLRHRGEELLGRRGGLRAWAADAVTFGIPLLHPWANRLARRGLAWEGVEAAWPDPAPGVRFDPNGLPIHGVGAFACDWRVEEHAADARRAWLRARLDFGADPERLAVFPFPHALEVTAELAGETLAITTTLRATGERTVPVAFGWHPYLRLPGVPRREWEVALPVRRRWGLDAGQLPTGEREAFDVAPGPLGERTFDDLFDAIAPGAPFVLEGGGRRIEQRHGPGYDLAVVYAPADDEVVCFEPMTAPTNPFDGGHPLLAVAPGESFSARFEIAVLEAQGAGRPR